MSHTADSYCGLDEESFQVVRVTWTLSVTVRVQTLKMIVLSVKYGSFPRRRIRPRESRDGVPSVPTGHTKGKRVFVLLNRHGRYPRKEVPILSGSFPTLTCLSRKISSGNSVLEFLVFHDLYLWSRLWRSHSGRDLGDKKNRGCRVPQMKSLDPPRNMRSPPFGPKPQSSRPTLRTQRSTYWNPFNESNSIGVERENILPRSLGLWSL